MSQPAGESTPQTELIEHMPYELDGGLARRAALGLIVLATDYTIEHEWRRLFAGLDGIALYHSRIQNQDRITPANLRAMEARLTECSRVITPDTALDVIAYGCTSASMAIGEEQVFARIREARPGVACTTPITAAFAAFDALGARRVGVLTPYPADVNRIVADYIAARGYAVPVFGSFNAEQDTVAARISPHSIERAVQEIAARAALDAVFVSCTSLRLLEACAGLERRLGLPLTSSNHAMAWHALRLAGIDDPLPQYGSLYQLPLPRTAP